MARFITIDPGLTGTGWAIWDTKTQIAPLLAGVWVAPQKEKGRDLTWLNRCHWLALKLGMTCAAVGVEACWIEYPIFFDDAEGHMGMKKGDIPKLIMLVGAMSYALHLGDVVCHLPSVREWKGQLSKQQVRIRCIKRLGEETCRGLKSHDWDAVGIGLWVQRLLTLKSGSTTKPGRTARVVRSGKSRTAMSSKKS